MVDAWIELAGIISNLNIERTAMRAAAFLLDLQSAVATDILASRMGEIAPQRESHISHE